MKEIWEKKLQEELIELRTRLEKIIDNNRLSLLGIEITLQAEYNSPESIQQVLDYISEKLTKAKESLNIEDFNKWDKLLLAVSNLYVLNNLNTHKVGRDIETAYYLYHLGNTSGYLDAFEKGTKHGELIEIYFHSKRSKEFQKIKRWGPFFEEREKLLKEIKKEVNKYYEDGGTAFHNDVARWFKVKPEYGDKYKDIPDDIIRKAIGEIAEKYGRKRGVTK